MTFPRSILVFAVVVTVVMLRSVETMMPNLKYGRVYYKIGLNKEKKHKINKALEYYMKAIRSDPGLFEAHDQIAGVYNEKGEYDRAIEYARKAAYLNQEYHQAYVTLGFAYRGKKEYRQSFRYFKKARLLYPHYPYVPEYTFNLGEAYLYLNDKDDALGELRVLRKLGEKEWAARLEKRIEAYPQD